VPSAGTHERKGREFEDGNGMPLPEGGHWAPDSGCQESPRIWTVSTAIHCHDRYDLTDMPFDRYRLKEWLPSFFPLGLS